MIDSPPAWAMIVPFKTITNVIRDSNIVKGRVGGALDDVDDSLFDSVHAGSDAWIGPARNLSLLSIDDLVVRSVCDLTKASWLGRVRSRSAFAATPLRRDSLRLLAQSLADRWQRSRACQP
jgi:hypothetical protein